MVSLPLVPLLYSILHILAIIIIRMDNLICMFLIVDCSCPGPWSLVLGHPGPLWFGSWSSVALWALDSCAYAFPMLLIPVESVLLASSTCSYHFSPYLPHALTKLARQSKILQQKPNLLLCDWSLPPSSAYVSTVPPYLHHIPVTLNYWFPSALCWLIFLVWNRPLPPLNSG